MGVTILLRFWKGSSIHVHSVNLVTDRISYKSRLKFKFYIYVYIYMLHLKF